MNPATVPPKLKVLAIGNSFSQSLLTYFPATANSLPGVRLEFTNIYIGGCSLERHWREFEHSEADPTFKPYGSGRWKKNLRDYLGMKKWDIVTLQQASAESWRPESFQPWAERLITLIRELAPQAEIVIQQTWSYRADSPLLAQWQLSQAEMDARLTENYRRLAAAYRFRVIPVGLAVTLERQQAPLSYRTPDPAATAGLHWPDLPVQAGDCVGASSYAKNRETGELYIRTDCNHLNLRGEYLQACVWSALLCGRAASEIRFTPSTIGDRDAAFLRRIAAEAVATFPQAAARP